MQRLRKKRRSVNGTSGTRPISNGKILDPFILMRNILEKLYLLDYQKHFLGKSETKQNSMLDRNESNIEIIEPEITFFPLYPSYFAQQTNIGEQFEYFSHLSFWLIRKHSENELNIAILELDATQDPNSICNNILLECKKLGMNSNFPASKLRTGSGLECCLILDFLTTFQLKSSQKIETELNQSPIFHKLKENDSRSSSMLAMDESKVDEEKEDIFEEVMDNKMHCTQGNTHRSESTHENRNTEDLLMVEGNDVMMNVSRKPIFLPMITSEMNGKEWMLELQQACNSLNDKQFMTDLQNCSNAEYISHMEKMEYHRKILHELIGKQNTKNSSMNKKLMRNSGKLSNFLKNIRAKENSLQSSFLEIENEYRIKSEHLFGVCMKEHKILVENVSRANDELLELNAKIAEIKQLMLNKNQSIMDQTPMKRVTKNIHILKKEMIEIDLKIGLNRQQLNHYRMKYDK